MKIYVVVWKTQSSTRLIKAFTSLESALDYTNSMNEALIDPDAEEYYVKILDLEN